MEWIINDEILDYKYSKCVEIQDKYIVVFSKYNDFEIREKILESSEYKEDETRDKEPLGSEGNSNLIITGGYSNCFYDKRGALLIECLRSNLRDYSPMKSQTSFRTYYLITSVVIRIRYEYEIKGICFENSMINMLSDKGLLTIVIDPHRNYFCVEIDSYFEKRNKKSKIADILKVHKHRYIPCIEI